MNPPDAAAIRSQSQIYRIDAANRLTLITHGLGAACLGIMMQMLGRI